MATFQIYFCAENRYKHLQVLELLAENRSIMFFYKHQETSDLFYYWLSPLFLKLFSSLISKCFLVFATLTQFSLFFLF